MKSTFALFCLLLLLPTTCLLAQVTPHLLLSGDHPDPSIIYAHPWYWVASTSNERSPEFPLFRSHDLLHWESAGAVFSIRPQWASGSFWAPELTRDGKHFLVFYTARKTNGPLCVAVATAPSPGGPYRDHGPLVCQPDGSIDPSFVRDEHGQPYLVWKEDGNSVNRPTPIWAQPLTRDLLHLTGKRHLLISNDLPWEGGVVEGPSIIRHNGRFFLFYAGNACCGIDVCHYAEGVARADHLLGPWQKNPANPLIPANERWACPGHGTAVHAQDGFDYLVYHAYSSSGKGAAGREMVIDQLLWGTDGWPIINAGKGPGAPAELP